jgi:hypothetical protein
VSARAALAAAVAAALGLGLLVVAGAQSPVTAVTPAEPMQQWRRDSVYLTHARALGADGSDSVLLGTARRLCEHVRDGWAPVALAVHVAERHRLAPEAASAVAGLAVLTHCPEYEGVVRGMGAPVVAPAEVDR